MEVLENELWHRWSNEGWRMSCDVGKACSFSNLSVTSPTSQLILQPFRRFTYITAHSPTLLLLHLSQLILQPSLLHLCHSSFSNLHYFTYDTAHSPNLPLLHLSQLILQPSLLHLWHSSFSNLHYFTYVTAHSPTFITSPMSQLILQPSLLHLCYSSFSKPSIASPVTAHSPTLPSLLLCHRIFTYVT